MLSGGNLVITKKENLLSPSAFEEVINRHKVQIAVLPVSYLHVIKYALGTLTTIISAGEALNIAISRHLISKGIRLINAYGPTEGTVCATLSCNPVTDNKSIVIGKPLNNVEVYILDEYEQLTPIGVVGEIHIGGSQVARGYLNRAELTKEKFISDPFRSGKIYKTGDLGRWMADGNIEYVSRKDEQFKFRGYRIEPGEIESAVLECEAVNQCVVAVNEDPEGDKRLVAYFISEGSRVLDSEIIVSHLKSKLPEYMVPRIFVHQESFPLTTNGKIDKQRLPDPLYSSPDHCNKSLSSIEEKLVEIWQRLLGIQGININDNFFQLGGHSLMAMRLISSVRNELELEVPIKLLFINPTIREFATAVNNQRNNLLLPPILVHPRSKYIPLSFSQERLWFIDQLEGSIPYHIPAVLKFNGNLNRKALAAAFKKIVDRHEVLRTVIKEEDGVPYQCIMDAGKWQLDIIDYSTSEKDAYGLSSGIQHLIDKPFDLCNDYMLRVHLITLKENEYVLVVTMHHIASDGWSMSVLAKELVELYGSFEQNREDKLITPVVQYADYAIWQRKYLQGEVLNKMLSYWEEKLQNVSPLNLPIDYLRPAVQSRRGATVSFTISQEVSEQLHRLSKQHDTTMFMTLLSVFNILLYKHSGQRDICIGTPAACRQQKEIEELIGFFVNILVLRTHLTDEILFSELLRQIRQNILEAYEHQLLPFEKLVDSMVKERDMSQSPLFQVMFVLQNTPQANFHLGNAQLSQEEFPQRSSKFDITFVLRESVDGLRGSVEYCADLFNKDSIHRMIGHYKMLLSAVVSNPSQSVSGLEMLGEAEKSQLIVEFNSNGAEFQTYKTIVDLFEEQVERGSDNLAVVFENEQFTYQQLNERSNQLAHYLRSIGVDKETLVPICIERSIEMIIGILGILKAGGAYVPIDPKYPAERIKSILRDTAATVVICSKSSKRYCGLTKDIEIVELELHCSCIDSYPTGNIQTDLTCSNLAYVIYTSGSTGVPKGVMIEHRSVVSLVRGVSFISLSKDDILLSTGAFCFDATTFEYWGMLLNGGQLLLCTEEHLLSSDFLKAEIQKRKVTKMWFVSSLLNQLVEADIDLFYGLKVLLVGGEMLSKKHIELIKSVYTGLEIINCYGPTENATFSLTYRIDDPLLNNSLPIGRPLSNRFACILDKEHHLLPIGVIGEICVGGVGLARGYLNNPELTNDKFFDSPFKQGERLYKTGDLGRWLPGGTVEFFGRLDDQVKIRGYRIEPGEVENILQGFETVKQCVVIARQELEINQKLVGYVVANRDFDEDAALGYLKKKLPEYMVPQLLVELESLPLTANGKLDRRALPDPSSIKCLSERWQAPRNEVEKSLAEIWQKLLRIKQVGIHDNFFKLGGDSLLTIQVVSRAKRLGYLLTPKDIFQCQTIEKLSKAIASSQKSIERTEKHSSGTGNLNDKFIVSIQEEGNNPPFFAIPGFLLYRELSCHLGRNQPFYGFEPLPLYQQRKHVEDIALQFITEMRSVQAYGPYYLGAFCGNYPVIFEMANQLLAQGEKVPLIALFESYAPQAIVPKRSFKYINHKLRFYVNHIQTLSTLEKGRFILRQVGLIFKLIYRACRFFKKRRDEHGIFMLQQEYILKPYIGKVVLFKSSTRSPAFSEDPLMGWQNYIIGEIETFVIPGDHLTIFKEPGVIELAEKLRTYITNHV